MIAMLAVSLALAAAPETFDVFPDKGDLFVRAGTNKGLKIGAEVKLLGEKIGNTEERRVVGKATVLEVWETLARVVPEDSVKGGSKPSKAQLIGVETVKAAPPAAAPVRAPAAAPAVAAAAAPAATAGCPETKGEVKEISHAFSVRDDHFTAKCCGVQVDAYSHGTMMGAALKLMVDGKLAEEQEPFSGNTVTLRGSSHGKPVALEIKVGAFGGDYKLKVNGQPCQLTKM